MCLHGRPIFLSFSDVSHALRNVKDFYLIDMPFFFLCFLDRATSCCEICIFGSSFLFFLRPWLGDWCSICTSFLSLTSYSPGPEVVVEEEFSRSPQAAQNLSDPGKPWCVIISFAWIAVLILSWTCVCLYPSAQWSHDLSMGGPALGEIGL